MDSVWSIREEATLAESARFVSRPFVIAAAWAVLLHTVVMLVHGAAHAQLKVQLSAWANIYVLCIVGVGPMAGLSLLRSSWQRTGATVLFISMSGALLFGLWKHFIAYSPDHFMRLQAGPWKLPFQATAVLLAVSESAGAVIAYMLLYALTRQAKARSR